MKDRLSKSQKRVRTRFVLSVLAGLLLQLTCGLTLCGSTTRASESFAARATSQFRDYAIANPNFRPGEHQSFKRRSANDQIPHLSLTATFDLDSLSAYQASNERNVELTLCAFSGARPHGRAPPTPF